MRLLFSLILLLPGSAVAHEALELDDPSLRSTAVVTMWGFAVLAGVAFLGSLGMALGNLGRRQNLVLGGLIGAVLSAGVAGAAGYALWNKQMETQNRITLHHTEKGWSSGYGRKFYLDNVLVLPVGKTTTVYTESEVGHRLQVPMLALDVEMPQQEVLILSLSVPSEGNFLAMDGKLTIRGVSESDYETFLREQSP